MLKAINSIKKKIVVSQVAIDKELWTEVPNFQSSQPNDNHYTVRTDNTGATWISFGDGQTGKRLPSGAAITASYRDPEGDVAEVSIKRAPHTDTPDVPLWILIRSSTKEISFKLYENAIEEPGRRCSLSLIIGLLLILAGILIGGVIVWLIFQR